MKFSHAPASEQAAFERPRSADVPSDEGLATELRAVARRFQATASRSTPIAKEQIMRKIVFAAAAIPMFAAAALAQNAADNAATNNAPAANAPAAPGPASTPPANMSDQPTTEHKTTAADVPSKGPSFINVPDSAMLSENVVGLDVYNSQNNDIGKIHDVIIDKDNKVTGYILSVGGFLGMGTHYVAVDPGAVNISYDDGNKTWRAAMNATKDELKSAPEFKYGGRWTASRS
jgi:sporulation protein YlmC with PRC-barrel domain